MKKPACVALLLISVSLAVSPRPARSETVEAANCSDRAVQSAIRLASDGDVVWIPAGTCTWSLQVTIPRQKGVTLQGAGIGNTTIVDANLDGPILVIELRAPRFTRVTDFTWDIGGIDKTRNRGSIEVRAFDDVQDAFRIDHMRFENIRERGIGVYLAAHSVSSLIDNNVFECPFLGSACQSVLVRGSSGRESSHMDRMCGFGGMDNFIFFEDNETAYVDSNDGGLEGYAGARYVFRYNRLRGHTQGHHGADSGNMRGTQCVEAYGNIGFRTGNQPSRLFNMRSGTGFVWGNEWRWNGNLHITNYRSDPGWAFPWLGDRCDGSHDHDGNQAKGGWPCIDQVGWKFTGDLAGTRTWEPFYAFLNREVEGRQADFEPRHVRGPKDAANNVYTHVVANREYFNENPGFTGALVEGNGRTGGVGIGPIADRPDTCDSGVGWWATDEGAWNVRSEGRDGRFYKCTRADTWRLWYVPAPYPHPLQNIPDPPNPPWTAGPAPRRANPRDPVDGLAGVRPAGADSLVSKTASAL